MSTKRNKPYRSARERQRRRVKAAIVASVTAAGTVLAAFNLVDAKTAAALVSAVTPAIAAVAAIWQDS